MAANKKATSKQQTESAYVWPVGIDQAAQYCGQSVANMKYHFYVAEDLKGRLIGHSLTFEQSDLDHFLAVKRRPGRPAPAEKDPSLVQQKRNTDPGVTITISPLRFRGA